MDLVTALGDALARAFEQRGYSSLTAVQEAVLAPEHAGRDLRVSSQTGSGKTVALGLAVRGVVTDDASPAGTHARPRALVVVPTRELAKQVHEELSWLFAPLGLRVAAVTGGGGYRDELRSFRNGPAIVVGTPGRLRDHLDRGSLETGNVAAVVLDEADRMLDFGFREEIEAIVGLLPEEKRVHLVSATFPREVKAFADRVQNDPAIVQGTALGAANQDIEHVVHLVHRDQRLDAIVNLLLSDPGAQTLIFCHTRADVADLGAALADIGFTVGTLSGEMEQTERNRALSLFKRGNLDAMVATDVAARGIDVADVSRVIHADAPNDADAYTHRSGRTGRAGRKGTSSVLVTPPALVRTLRTLERARVKWRMVPIPTADEILAARDEQLFAELTGGPSEGDTNGSAARRDGDGDELSPRLVAFAERVLASADASRVVARLLARVRGSGPAPRHVTPLAPPAERRRDGARGERFERPERPERFERPERGAERFDRGDRGPRDDQGEGGAFATPSRRPMTSGDPSFRPFRISWGQMQGADARRLLAVVCRRGNIRGSDVGAIRLAPSFSVVEVRGDVAAEFERAARVPDPRAPRVQIRPWVDEGGERPEPRASRDAFPAPSPVPPPVPRERPSRARPTPVADEPEPAVPAERPSRARPKADEATNGVIPPERPSRARASKGDDSAPAIPPERPSRARASKLDETLIIVRKDEERPRYGANARPTPRDLRPERPAPADRAARGPGPDRDRGPARDHDRSRGPGPARDRGPGPNRGPARDHDRSRGPARDYDRSRGPGSDRGPARDRGPGPDRGPARDYDRSRGPARDRGPGPARGPAPAPTRDRAAERPERTKPPRIIRGPVRPRDDADKKPKKR